MLRVSCLGIWWRYDIWKSGNLKMWLSQEREELSRWKKNNFSLFHKSSLLDIQTKLIKIYRTQPLNFLFLTLKSQRNCHLWKSSLPQSTTALPSMYMTSDALKAEIYLFMKCVISHYSQRWTARFTCNNISEL